MTSCSQMQVFPKPGAFIQSSNGEKQSKKRFKVRKILSKLVKPCGVSRKTSEICDEGEYLKEDSCSGKDNHGLKVVKEIEDIHLIQDFPIWKPLPLWKKLQLHCEDTEYGVACQALARRLGEELRSAKSAQLSCGEVLLPVRLLPRVANQILIASEKEPCGLRGCTLDINLETEDNAVLNISSIVWDPSISSTFQLTLTFRQDCQRKWHSRLSQFLKTLTKGRTIVISSDFHLEKTRLYRSLSC